MAVVFGNFYDPFRQVDRLASSLLRTVDTPANSAGYDLVRTGDNAFAVAIAVPGFTQDELSLTVEKGVLFVRGTPKSESVDGVTYIHRGIARGAFERRFGLAEHVDVAGASLENGVLRISLVREVPEVLKPRAIAIGAAPSLAKAA